MTYKSFTTADEVLDRLFEQFEMTPPAGLGPIELEQWKEKRLRPTRRRVLTVLQVWTDDFGLLKVDHHVAPRIVNFVSAITSPLPIANAAREVLRSLERFVSASPFLMSAMALILLSDLRRTWNSSHNCSDSAAK